MRLSILIFTLLLLSGCDKEPKSKPIEQKTSAVASVAKSEVVVDNKKQTSTPSADEAQFLTTDGKSITNNTEIGKREVKVMSEQELAGLTANSASNQPRQRGAMSYAEATQQRPDLFYDTGKYDSRYTNAYQARSNYQYQQMAEHEQQTALQMQKNQQNFEREMQARQADMQRQSDERKREAIKAVSQPIAGSKGLTRSQREAIASIETGQPMPSHNDSYGNNNSQNNTPKYTSNCDGSGCWGTDGTRYNNSGTGDYYSSDGKFCQNIGGQMHCN